MQILGLISDVLLLAATGGMALWCRVLTKRLKAFNDLDTGLGGTIAALKLQADDLQASIAVATEHAHDRGAALDEATTRADDRIGRMEMLLTSLEDLEAEAADRLLAEPTVDETVFVPNFRAARSATRAAEFDR